MSKIVIDNVLEAIHFILKHNGFEFSDKQLEKADQFIIPFIDEVNIEEKEFNVITPGAPKLSLDKRINPLVIKYFAFIEDNMKLYSELLEEEYMFSELHGIKFYALDKSITSKFKKNEYKNILLKHEGAISTFYKSLRGSDKSEKEKYISEFSDIVHLDHTTLEVGSNGDMSDYNFLTKKNIDSFGKEYLVSLNTNQRNIINRLHFNYNEEDVKKIKELLSKYPDYSGIQLDSSVLKNFSVEEISSMSHKDYYLYDAALKCNLINRIRGILKKDPTFNCPVAFVKEEIFRILSDDEILELSDSAKDKISKIKIPEIDNVLVMPFNKVNRIVLFDKASRKIDSIKKGYGK